jgi:hypothetical protein
MVFVRSGRDTWVISGNTSALAADTGGCHNLDAISFGLPRLVVASDDATLSLSLDHLATALHRTILPYQLFALFSLSSPTELTFSLGISVHLRLLTSGSPSFVHR